MNSPIAKLNGIYAGYNNEPVIRSIYLDVHANDFIGVIGPNGGGKTTLIKVLLGILKPYKGSVEFPSGKIKIGYLPQASQIDKSFPISVKEVVQSGLKPAKSWNPVLSPNQKQKVIKLLNESGLQPFAKRPIGSLSGGQLQRVLLCRAIVNEPDLLVLDEPNTFVDKTFEHEFYQWLQQLNKRMAVILVSHDIGTILSLVKTIACVNGDLHYHPSNAISAGLLKVYNCPVDLIAHRPILHRVLNKH